MNTAGLSRESVKVKCSDCGAAKHPECDNGLVSTGAMESKFCENWNKYLKREALRSSLQKSGIPQEYFRFTFHTLDGDAIENGKRIEGANAEIRENLVEWSRKPHGWRYLEGKLGCGKTSLMIAAIGNYARAGGNVRVISLPAFIAQMQPNMQDAPKVMEALQKIHVLGVDDLGAQRDTSFAAELVYRLLDWRYMANLPTLITSNLNLRQLAELPLEYQRIADRIVGQTKPNGILKLRGDSRR